MAVPGITIRIEHDDARIRAGLLKLLAFGRDQRAAMRDIATLGESSTRERFHTETDPDGSRWVPLKSNIYDSINKKHLRKDGRLRNTAAAFRHVTNRKILTLDGHLGDSISNRSDRDYAEWGVNRIYAAIHQFGGKAGRGLRAQIPARPYLGISAGDEADILNILEQRIQGALK